MPKDKSIRFTVNGQVFKKSREDFLKIPVVIPLEMRKPKYSVLLGCRRLSPQQAIAQVTGIPSRQVTSQTASRILQRLGFPVDKNDY
jgi:hypothetical protein